VSWPTFAAIYFIMWWTVLFAVLPWGVRSQSETGEAAPGTDPGPPSVPALGKKACLDDADLGRLFGVFYYCYVTRLITLDNLGALFGMR
jgi:Predicted secreted protein